MTMQPTDREKQLSDIILNNEEVVQKQSGFFPLSILKTCRHPEHNPPMHLYIPPDMGYRHICPACGKSTIIYSGNITL